MCIENFNINVIYKIILYIYFTKIKNSQQISENFTLRIFTNYLLKFAVLELSSSISGISTPSDVTL